MNDGKWSGKGPWGPIAIYRGLLGLHVYLGKIAIGGEVPTGDIGDLAPMDPGVLFALFLSRTKLGPIWGFDSFLGKVRTRPFLVII